MLADIFKKPNDVFYLAEHGSEFCGAVNISRFPRLKDCVRQTSEGASSPELMIEFKSGKSRDVGFYLELSIRGEVALTCQRCLQSLLQSIEIKRLFGIVSSDYFSDRLPEQYEPLIVEEGDLSIVHLIEDEVLLECPLVPYHEDRHCNHFLNDLKENESEHLAEPQLSDVSSNPFSVLKQLKKEQN